MVGPVRVAARSRWFAVLALLLAARAGADGAVYLQQNWDDADRSWFYHVNQGSRLIDTRVFMHLERSAGGGRFAEDDYLATFGFLPDAPNQHNPLGLPVGFARDRDMLGLTCAACHTGEFEHNGARIRIDGGQARLDLQRFLAALELALARTLDDADRFTRFVEASAMAPDVARDALERALQRRAANNKRNHTSLRYGPSRLDAFGAILNKGLALTGVDNNMNPPDGPTSYPYLWDTPQHDWVEWNGSSPNPREGALARNVGEVIGVYGEVDVERAHIFGVIDNGYPSSVQVRALRRVEKRVAKLHSPRWPEKLLTRIDRDLAAAGEALFATYCGACHLPIERADPERRIQVRMSSLDAIGTDPKMALNVFERMGKSGRFAGEQRFYIAGDVIEAEAPALYIVNHIMGGVLYNHKFETLLADRDARVLGHGDERHPPKFLDGEPVARGSETSMAALAAYKARPLNGIWATAPYLHNGSVPNLYELMLPAAQRSVMFTVGRWEFDPARVGFSTRICDSDFVFDTRIPGNSNSGHEYGTGADGLAPLDEAQRRAIVEYMKTL